METGLRMQSCPSGEDRGCLSSVNGLSYSSVASILKNNIDRCPPDPDAADGPTIHHQHLRGPTYFHQPS
jgi:hypothetical protein